MISVFANGPGSRGLILDRAIPKAEKLVLDVSLLGNQHYEVQSKVNWSNLGKEVVPSSTPRCSSYWKLTLRVALNYCRPTYIYRPKFENIILEYIMIGRLCFTAYQIL